MMPLYALANGPYRGRLPEEFQDLTWIEERVCGERMEDWEFVEPVSSSGSTSKKRRSETASPDESAYKRYAMAS